MSILQCWQVSGSMSVSLLMRQSSGSVRFWQFNVGNRKIRPIDVRTGLLKRIIKCMTVTQEKRKCH